MSYVFHVVVLASIYAMLGLSLNLVAGTAGLLSIAHAAFFGAGAYVCGWLSIAGLPFPGGAAAGILAGGTLGLAVASVSLRLRDDSFVIASFCFQVLFFQVVNNSLSVTGGPAGLTGIPPPRLFGGVIDTPAGSCLLVAACAVATWVLCQRLVGARFGRLLRVIREDEVLASAFGHNVSASKLAVFATAGAIAGLAGVLYGSYFSYIDPTSFSLGESILILTIVILGGAGSMAGTVFAAVLMIALPEALRFIGLPAPLAAHLRQVLYGSVLVVVMTMRPRGLFGEFAFGERRR